jgi:hypothetical protein
MMLRKVSFYLLRYLLILLFFGLVSAQTKNINPEKISGIWQWVKSYPADSKNKEFYSQNSSSTVKLLKQYSFHVSRPTNVSKLSSAFFAAGEFQLELNTKVNVGTYRLSGNTLIIKFEDPSNPNVHEHSWKVKIKRITKNTAEVLSIEDNYVHVFKKIKNQ